MVIKFFFVFLFITPCFLFSFGQNLQSNEDSIFNSTKNLPDITVVGRNSKTDMQQMPEVVGTSIYAGKKNALIIMKNVLGNISNNTMRQILSKIAGIHIWESDPSGIQIGIAARGLSPNRSWEFNIRQNGYDISADPYGYPEAYYNPQVQSVQRIEIIRGQGSLQYGPQFGGMVNYILKNGSEINKPFEFETQQTMGSNQMVDLYNAVGGKWKKINYYTFIDYRKGEGYRANSNYFTKSGFSTITYNFSSKFSVTGEIMVSHIRSQQPGGLSDSLFNINSKQSLRSRNWFDITWTIPAIIINYNINDKTRWNTKIFGTIGDRNSIGYMNAITVKDSINSSTLQYNNRTLLADQYRNYGIESKLLTNYKIGNIKNTISTGIRLYTGTTHRRSNGKGSTDTEYNMNILGDYPNDIKFYSKNFAWFAENIFRLNKKLSIVPGIRFEWLKGSVSGRNGYNNNGNPITLQNIVRERSFILTGVGVEYHISSQTEFYSNISQAYRPIQFANLQAPPTTDVIDENLKDAKGYNFDLGYRGSIKDLIHFDLTGYLLKYNNRIGVIIPSGQSYRLITNVGNSISKGFEGYIEVNLLRLISSKSKSEIKLFTSYSFTDARYDNDYKDEHIKGKQIENAPRHIIRTGATFIYKNFKLTNQFSYVDDCYSDAGNTKIPTANGQTGIIPSYRIFDLSAAIDFKKTFNFKAGINNLLNEKYFTRRSSGYPGPGLLPGDGRTFFITLGAKL
jgi:Fe(3+) dicitrate transport protein